MTYNFDINNRAFNAIKNRTKRVEIRCTKTGNNHFDYSVLKPNDYIIFESNGEKIKCLVEEINHYKTVEELFVKVVHF